MHPRYIEDLVMVISGRVNIRVYVKSADQPRRGRATYSELAQTKK